MTMNMTLRPYNPSDAATITSWIKDEYLFKVFSFTIVSDK